GLVGGVEVEDLARLGRGAHPLEVGFLLLEPADRGALHVRFLHPEEIEALLQVPDVVLRLRPVLPDPLPHLVDLRLLLHLIERAQELLLGIVDVAQTVLEDVFQRVHRHGSLRGPGGTVEPAPRATSVPGARPWPVESAPCVVLPEASTATGPAPGLSPYLGSPIFAGADVGLDVGLGVELDVELDVASDME